MCLRILLTLNLFDFDARKGQFRRQQEASTNETRTKEMREEEAEVNGETRLST